MLSFGVGFDDNANQSGSAATFGVAGTGGSRSAASTVSANLGFYRRRGEWAFGPHYQLDAYLLAAGSSRALSVQQHRWGFGTFRAFGSRTLLWMSGSARLQLSGLTSPLWLAAAGLFETGLKRSFDERWRSSAQLAYAGSRGGRQARELSGHSLQVDLREQLTVGAFDGALALGLDLNAIGSQSWPLDASFFSCAASRRCQQLLRQPAARNETYRVPLGYLGPVAQVEVGYMLWPTGRAALQAGYRYRRYLENSGSRAFAITRKRRIDHRVELSSRLEWLLSPVASTTLWVSHSYLRSLSNMDAGDRGLEHAFDYADQNFDQHVVLVGFSLAK